MVEINYVEIPDSCFVCKYLVNGNCTKHHLSNGKLHALIMKKNPYRLAESMCNIICDDGFEHKALEKSLLFSIKGK